MVAQTQKFVVGLDGSTGNLLWQIPFTTDFDQNAFTPVVYQDLVILGGLDHPLVALRPTRAGGRWTARMVWNNPQTPMFMSSPVLIEGTLYGLTSRSKGRFVAIDAASGRTLWQTEGREGDNASMFGSRQWLLASTTEGVLVVAQSSPLKYDEVRRYRITPSALWAHPAVTAASLVVKDVDRVICWGF